MSIPYSASSAFHLFPTSHRTKPSKAVSYPIGAKIVSRSLADVPPAPLITCDFYAWGRQQSLHLKETFPGS